MMMRGNYFELELVHSPSKAPNMEMQLVVMGFRQNQRYAHKARLAAYLLFNKHLGWTCRLHRLMHAHSAKQLEEHLFVPSYQSK